MFQLDADVPSLLVGGSRWRLLSESEDQMHLTNGLVVVMVPKTPYGIVHVQEECEISASMRGMIPCLIANRTCFNVQVTRGDANLTAELAKQLKPTIKLMALDLLAPARALPKAANTVAPLKWLVDAEVKDDEDEMEEAMSDPTIRRELISLRGDEEVGGFCDRLESLDDLVKAWTMHYASDKLPAMITKYAGTPLTEVFGDRTLRCERGVWLLSYIVDVIGGMGVLGRRNRSDAYIREFPTRLDTWCVSDDMVSVVNTRNSLTVFHYLVGDLMCVLDGVRYEDRDMEKLRRFFIERVSNVPKDDGPYLFISLAYVLRGWFKAMNVIHVRRILECVRILKRSCRLIYVPRAIKKVRAIQRMGV